MLPWPELLGLRGGQEVDGDLPVDIGLGDGRSPRFPSLTSHWLWAGSWTTCLLPQSAFVLRFEVGIPEP